MLTGLNISQLTKSVDGIRLVSWFDWKSFLSTMFKTIPNITTYHHFRFNKRSPGILFVRELIDSTEKAITMSSEKTLDPQALPEQVIPKGLNIVRKWYLFDEIAKFCSSPETAAITCPHPNLPKPSSDDSTAISQSEGNASNNAEDGGKRKRKRTCSHCHLEGHTKTKKGKITCPALLQK